MQAIIVLYMIKSLHYADDKTYLLVGAFSSLLYLTPVIGGYLADRFMGFRQSMYWGGVLLIAGYVLAAIPTENAFFYGLSFVIVGNGFFKPSVSSIVGDLYAPDDSRHESGYTIFYMGINLGSMIPPLFIGYLVSHYGWHWGFLLAAFGALGALINFFAGRKSLGTAGQMPLKSPIHDIGKRGLFFSLLVIGIALMVYLVHLVFYIPEQANLILISFSILILLAVIWFLVKENNDQRRKMIACLILILISVGFWALYFQTYTSLMLFADRNMGKEMLGFPVDAEFTQFFNPFIILLLSPIFSWLWGWLENKRLNPSTPLKFSFGILLMAFGFLFLGGAAAFLSPNGITSPWWLAVSYIFQASGELLLSPIGLAMITRLSPRHLVGMMMGVWFFMQSAAFSIGGLLSTLADVPKHATAIDSINIYSHAFNVFGIFSMSLAIVSFLLMPYLKRLINSNQGE